MRLLTNTLGVVEHQHIAKLAGAARHVFPDVLEVLRLPRPVLTTILDEGEFFRNKLPPAQASIKIQHIAVHDLPAPLRLPIMAGHSQGHAVVVQGQQDLGKIWKDLYWPPCRVADSTARPSKWRFERRLVVQAEVVPASFVQVEDHNARQGVPRKVYAWGLLGEAGSDSAPFGHAIRSGNSPAAIPSLLKTAALTDGAAHWQEGLRDAPPRPQLRRLYNRVRSHRRCRRGPADGGGPSDPTR
mmetsp:Transcript_152745/g.489959  ORF Transcript_152745/g.489959 Transcript_152745/m.489959 type:complete len:242 (-) Transcript_152745:17-742(-)